MLPQKISSINWVLGSRSPGTLQRESFETTIFTEDRRTLLSKTLHRLDINLGHSTVTAVLGRNGEIHVGLYR